MVVDGDFTSPRPWRGLFNIDGLKPPALWERAVAITEPTITAHADGRIEVTGGLPGQPRAYTFTLPDDEPDEPATGGLKLGSLRLARDDAHLFR